MPHLLDGDNLLGSWPGRKRSDAERRAVAREIGSWATRERRRVVLVFDGPSPVSLPGGADVRFSGPGRSADQLILAALREETDRAGWTVVTNDRPLADQCRWLGAKVERCDVFRKRLTAAAADEKPAREDDIDDWLGIFGGE